MAQELFLWSHPVSSYAQKVRIALREKKIPFQFQTPNGGGTGNKGAMESSFVNRNMQLEMPLLIDGDFAIFDSTIILEYLEDKYPESPLRPRGSMERARARMIEDVCDTQYEAINWAMGEVNVFQRAKGDSAARLKEQAKHQLKQIYAWLTEQLNGAEWFGGEQFGWADVCVWPVMNRSTSFHLEPEPGTALRIWYERAKERESVKSVYEEFRAATSVPNTAVDALQKGLMRRQYRDHRAEWLIKSGGIEIIDEGLKKGNIRFSWPDPLELRN